MAEFQEEVYIIEKAEITEDEQEDLEYDDLLNDPDLQQDDLDINDEDLDKDSDDDLNDFEALKKKLEVKAAKNATLGSKLGSEKTLGEDGQIKPAEVQRPVVIDDFIRNFLTKLTMQKTMNTFQQEWHDIQKKGGF